MVCSSFFTKFNDLINLSRISRSYSLFSGFRISRLAFFDPSNLLRSLSHTVQLALRKIERQVRLESRYNRIFNQRFRNVSSISFLFLVHLHLGLFYLFRSYTEHLLRSFDVVLSMCVCVSGFFLFSWLNLGF